MNEKQISSLLFYFYVKTEEKQSKNTSNCRQVQTDLRILQLITSGGVRGDFGGNIILILIIQKFHTSLHLNL